MKNHLRYFVVFIALKMVAFLSYLRARAKKAKDVAKEKLKKQLRRSVQ